MPDILDADGLQTLTQQEIVNDLTQSFINIYGSDINVDQNSPDGQLINIFAQGATSVRELLTNLYNSFDPDNAQGVILDQRANINNISRKGGTYTIVDITLVVNRTVTLIGLDADFNNPNGVGYTVQDNAGNEFILVNTVTLTAGTHNLNFRAKNIGRVETTIGTITTPVTIVLGVVSVNNLTTAIQTGANEETDVEFKLRRRQSLANASSGYLNGLLGTVLDLEGVTDAALYENYTNVVDADGIPAHGIWLIVEGGSAADIANAIYTKKSYGANMKGDITYTITTVSGQPFIARWDNPTSATLYVRFDIKQLAENVNFDLNAIKQYIIDNVMYTIGGNADATTLICAAQAAINAYGGNGLALNLEISQDNTTWTDFIEGSKQAKFGIADIAITVTT